MTPVELVVVPDEEALATAASARFVSACHHAVARRGRFAVALAGGSTPLALYRLLADRTDLPWERVVVAWGDERFVPVDDPARNERAARSALLDHVGVPHEATLSWGWGDDPEQLADAYEAALARALGDPPSFDLVLLGLGDDAHTASLWPGAAALSSDRLTAVTQAPDGAVRLTLTPRALGRADEVLVLVSGAAKRGALRRTLDARSGAGAPTTADPPLAHLEPHGTFVVLADASASGPADGVTVEG